MPLFLFVMAFFGGYWVGGRSRGKRELAASLQREASALLDSLGRLSSTGALRQIGDLKLRHGSDRDGVQISVRTCGAGFVEPDDWA